ncbi:D-alanine--D-alanine ligase [Candidatus Bipolaricaulota bacterium]|nr:D-alanine--D-alanine ligase [Candidatus Bipolaricaulota bacterium]
MAEQRGLDVRVLRGGNSSEREVSLKSGKNVIEALASRDNGYNPIDGEFSNPDEILNLIAGVDLVFNCLHGGIGENGTVQTLLETLDVPYTGTGPYGSALAMDKIRSKQTFERADIKTPDFYLIEEDPKGFDPAIISEEFGYPTLLKPVHEGSSRGIRVIDTEEELAESFCDVQARFGKVFVEQFISGKDITAGVLRYEGELLALPLVELHVKNEPFFNYNAKYGHDETEFIVPARLNDQITEEVKNLAVKAHRAHTCSGYSRVDFRVDRSGEAFALEVNTLPGMTDKSDLPFAARYAGISFAELVETMIENSLETNDTPGE